ncbi:MAG TPA: HAMP domain-containing sensor histidine kinase [Polyangiaceae bacterium]|nr:HAMP domain-containing sensor histidine kinase [Polyangiaceae bacterium]
MSKLATCARKPRIVRAARGLLLVRVLLRRSAMGDVAFVDGCGTSSTALDLAAVDAPLLWCADNGRLRLATPAALALLRRMSVGEQPRAVPADLWRLLERAPTGQAVDWRPPGARQNVLGCTRYAAGPGGYLLLMREVSAQHIALSERLHRQRLDSTERLVASIAHDIRSSVASVVYSASFLEVSGAAILPSVLSETLRDISKASASLQFIVDALLDYAKLGPNVSVPVLLREAISRALGALRAHYQEGAHRLRMDVAPRAECVLGNPIVIEQIFVNLLLNAVEASVSPRCVIVTAFPAPAPGGGRADDSSYVCIRVWDDGPGIPADLRQYVFDPFFSTKLGGTGLGLAIARQAAESLNGLLELIDDEAGTCFSLCLPSCEAAR